MLETKENGAATGAGETRRVELAVTGMTCAACARRVERGLSKTPGAGAAFVYSVVATVAPRLVAAGETTGAGGMTMSGAMTNGMTVSGAMTNVVMTNVAAMSGAGMSAVSMNGAQAVMTSMVPVYFEA